MSYFDCSIPENKKRVSQIISKLKEGVEIGNGLQIRNLLYNEAYVDLMIAVCLDHKYNIETQDGDALDTEGNPVEYKCIVKKKKGYSGSFQFHWLSKQKVAKYNQCTHFYFAWRDAFEIEKIIKVSKDVLMSEIIKKAGPGGSTAGHKSFSTTTIENLVTSGKAEIVYSHK